MLTEGAINILQYVNLAITALFIVAYVARLCRLRHLAISQRYSNSYPRIRIILCGIYMLISVAFLITSLTLNLKYSGKNINFWLVEGIGEILDSLILIMQSFTLRQQLRKEKPYTSLHLIYCIYLNILCLSRIIIIAIQVSSGDYQFSYLFFFYLGFQIVAVLLLGYWIAKRQELPQFDDNRKFNTDELSNNSKLLMNRNIQISYLRKISQHFTFIRPTVVIEKQKFRIILEIYDVDSRISEEDRKSMTEKELMSKLKIISDSFYSMNQIKELYKLCGRFTIDQRLTFEGVSPFQFYQNLQSYLNELFQNKKHYHKFLLEFFEVSEDYMIKFDAQLRNTIKGSQFDMFAHLDKNAPIISIRIFKQLWIDDHYLFYIDVIASDGSFESRPMKRFNDFESFHNNLTALIKKNYNGRILLPHLPKKYLFNWDQEKITQRRMELQRYLRGITNDYNIMIKSPQLRDYILLFLNCQDVKKITPSADQLKHYYKNIEIFKGNITKCLTHNEYVTFYQFKIFQNGIELKKINKRFNQFVMLHQGIQRQMHNSQIEYKFLVLPEKHLYKSDQHRHDKLKGYLENVIEIKQPWEIYPINDFFGFGSAQISYNEYSSILNNQLSREERNSRESREQIYTSHSPILIDQSSVSSKNRMSAMIDQLGF